MEHPAPSTVWSTLPSVVCQALPSAMQQLLSHAPLAGSSGPCALWSGSTPGLCPVAGGYYTEGGGSEAKNGLCTKN